jgi:hypothetical protein
MSSCTKDDAYFSTTQTLHACLAGAGELIWLSWLDKHFLAPGGKIA